MEDNDSEDTNNWGGFFTILGIVIGVILVLSIFGSSSKYEGQTAEEWFNDYDYCFSQVEEANSRIEEANYNIEEANSKIEDAKWCSYGSCDYEEMQDKINSLETAETVDPVEEP